MARGGPCSASWIRATCAVESETSPPGTADEYEGMFLWDLPEQLARILIRAKRLPP
jgi:hypothetical protein